MNDKIRNIYIQKLLSRRMSESTIKNYTPWLDKFISYIGDKQIKDVSSSDFNSFIMSQVFTSASSQNSCISAIKFLYGDVLNRKYSLVDFKRPKGDKKLPQVIDHEEIVLKLSLIKNIKHRAILSVIYSCGLRRSELVNLRINDIDVIRRDITIRNGKGRKDRKVPLSPNIELLLVSYIEEYDPIDYLFNGEKRLKYSASSIYKLVKKYLGISHYPHKLRHSMATTLIDNGTDISVVQGLLGHNNITTTRRYVHVSKRMLDNVNMVL